MRGRRYMPSFLLTTGGLTLLLFYAAMVVPGDIGAWACMLSMVCGFVSLLEILLRIAEALNRRLHRHDSSDALGSSNADYWTGYHDGWDDRR